MPIHNPDPAAAPTGLYVARRDGPEDFLPTSGAPVVLDSSGTGYTFGAWESYGAPDADFYVSTFHVVTTGVWGALEHCIVELAYGVDKAPIDVTRGTAIVVLPGASTSFYIPHSIVSRAVRVPAGEIIYGRLANSADAVRQVETFLTGWPAPFPAWEELDENTVPGPGRFYPSNVTDEGVALATGASWAYGDDVTAVASAPNDLLIAQVVSPYGIAQFLTLAAAVQVGYGASGEETWCATLPFGRVSYPPWLYPPILIREGERIAVRAAANAAIAVSLFLKVYDL